MKRWVFIGFVDGPKPQLFERYFLNHGIRASTEGSVVYSLAVEAEQEARAKRLLSRFAFSMSNTKPPFKVYAWRARGSAEPKSTRNQGN